MRLESLLENPALRLALYPLLWPASRLYGAGLALDRRRRSLTRVALPVPTISVGNLTVGGTGKTPVLLRLVADLKADGRRPFVLTRGYAGAGVSRAEGVVRSPSEAARFSDEIRLMAERHPGVPIVAAADRAGAAKNALAADVGDVAVLDDGFQHWALERDLDIVCVDATDPWGGGSLLPLGKLREPATSLARAGIVLITRCDRVSPAAAAAVAEAAVRLAPEARVVRTRFALSLATPAGAPATPPAKALAVSAIGNPAAFEAAIRDLGSTVIPCRYGDHHNYTEGDAARLVERAHEAGAAIVTTEKDWMKLRGFGGTLAGALVAQQRLVFDEGEDAWRKRVRAAFEK